MSTVKNKTLKDLTQEDLDLLYNVPAYPCYICKSVRCYNPDCIKLYNYICGMKKYKNTGLEEIAEDLANLNATRKRIKEKEDEINEIKKTETECIKKLQKTGVLDASGRLIRTIDDLKINSVAINNMNIEKMEQEIAKLKKENEALKKNA